MQPEIERVEAAINDLKQGKMIILTDDPDRENEGDLIIPAEQITTEKMNFIIRQGTGIVCLSLKKDKLSTLNLPLMLNANENTSSHGTPFTISVDAKDGITTGVSAADRTHTIHTMINDNATPNDLVKPGHIFPLQAKDGGVLERQGHTEGAVDLATLAGYKPAAVLCEIMNPDGTMTRGKQLNDFAVQHNIKMLAISDIVTYRLSKENLIESETSAILPMENYGSFKITIVKEKITGNEHVVLSKEKSHLNQPMLVRIHSSCMTGDLFSSKRCDCNKQLHHSLERISTEGGMLIYLNQEGRGIGIFNKIKAYALQEKGFDTVDANIQLGLPIDARQYYIAANILRNHGINHIRLLTNNPHKMDDMKKYGITTVERETMPTFSNDNNQHYLMTKKEKLNQTINLDFLSTAEKGNYNE